MDFGIGIATRQRLVEVGAAGRGAGLHPRLVLRHADDHRRLLCRDGGGGAEDLAHPARHRRAGAVKPHRRGHRQCLRDAERAGAGAHRFRHRHRLFGAPRDGARRRSSSPRWKNTSASSTGCWPARRSRRRSRASARKIRFLNPEIGLINTKDPIPLHISAYGPRSQALTAKLDAGWKSFISDVRGAHRRDRGHAAELDGGRARCRRPLRHGLDLRLRVGRRRAGRQPARDGAGRAARRRAAAPRRRFRHGGLAEHVAGAAGGRRRGRRLCRDGAPVTSRPTRAI